MTDSPLQPALDAAIESLESLGLRYALVGGLAVGAWGAPRATKDVDLYAELATAIRPRLQRELLQRDFDVPARGDEVTERLKRARHDAARRAPARGRRRGDDR